MISHHLSVATGLPHQLELHIASLAVELSPCAAALDRKFTAVLRRSHSDPRIVAALTLVTPGAAARVLQQGGTVLQFFQQVTAAGIQLAQLNVSSQAVVEALQHYDTLLSPMLPKFAERGLAGMERVREQIHFSIVLALNEAYSQVRELETQALHETIAIELEASNLDVLLRRFLEVIAKVFGAHAGHLFLLRDNAKHWTLRASTAHAASVHTINERPSEAWLVRALSSRILISAKSGNRYLLDPGWKGLYASVWSFPLMRHGKIQGVMQLGFDHPRIWLPREEQLLAAATERCMAAAEKARLVEDLAVREQQIRQLAEHMLHVEERERRRISRELHDEAGQSLICIRLQLELLEMSLDPQSDVVKRLAEVRDITEHTILEMRRLIADLSPVVLEQFGLESALRQLLKRFQSYHDCKVSFKTQLRKRLPPQLEIVAYRIIQECFNNISKHSKASNVNISLSSADGVLRLVISDNGIGFHVESALAQKDSFGLAGIRERVALLGGHFLIESRQSTSKKGARGKKRGTSLSIEVPIPSQTEW